MVSDKPEWQPKYPTPESMQEAIDAYFDDIINHNRTCAPHQIDAPTMTGLAIKLGFTSRQAILNYELRKCDEFGPVVQNARIRLEEYLEKALHTRSNVHGVTFSLKNNCKGWADKTESVTTNTNLTSGGLSVTFVEPNSEFKE